MKKIIDDRGRLFGRVSVIDVIVAIVAVVLVVAFYTKFNVHDTPLTSRDTTEITYIARIGAIRSTSANLLRIGDKLYLKENGAYLGTITDIEITDAESTDTLLDGSIIMSPIEERYDVKLTVVAYGSVSNGRVYIDRSFELSANASYAMFTKYNDYASVLVTAITMG